MPLNLHSIVSTDFFLQSESLIKFTDIIGIQSEVTKCTDILMADNGKQIKTRYVMNEIFLVWLLRRIKLLEYQLNCIKIIDFVQI